MARRYPPEICDTCEAEADAHWLTDRLQYCPHNKAIAWRGDPAAPWNIHHKAKPEHFAKVLKIALATFEQHCRKTGVTMAEGDRRLMLLRKLGAQ